MHRPVLIVFSSLILSGICVIFIIGVEIGAAWGNGISLWLWGIGVAAMVNVFYTLWLTDGVFDEDKMGLKNSDNSTEGIDQ